MSTETSRKKHKDSPPSKAEIIHKRETTRKKIVHRDPDLLRVQDAIEHILVAGSKVRRDDWRRREFCKREDNRLTTETPGCPLLNATTDMAAAPVYSPHQQGQKRKRSPNTGVHHAEDLRIYGKRYNSHLPAFAPNQKPSGNTGIDLPKSDDTEWNFEHGDSISPILFRMARLSGEYPSEEELARFNYPRSTLSNSLTSTNVALEETDVPRAVIERCWERAVHIASNVLTVPVTAVPTNTTAAGSIRDMSSSRLPSSIKPFDINTPLSQETCRKKCKSLGIDIERLRTKSQAAEILSDTTCPRCTRSFPTSKELLDHFYGTTQATGCCRALIRPRHLQLIRKLLQNYTESQTDQLGALLLNGNSVSTFQTPREKLSIGFDGDDDFPLSSLKHKSSSNTPKIDGWRDVRRHMEYAVENSKLILTGNASTYLHTRHPVQQSIQVSLDMTTNNDEEETASSQHTALPLIMNPMILEAVDRRLMDRYADVPP